MTMTTKNPMHPSIERSLQEVQASASHSTPEESFRALTALHSNVGHFVESAKSRLLATTLAWLDEQKAEARWIYQTNHRLAALGTQITEALRQHCGIDDPRTLNAMALAFLYTGESMKWELVTGAHVARDYRALHAFMGHLIAAGRQRTPIRLDVGGRERACTLESLYFRALLLARFASGIVSRAQIEILDEWIWIWSPILQGVPEAPAGSALRADLDSSEGLQRGPRVGEGPALYLLHAPIEAAFHELVGQFHAGQIVPSEGCTAAFRIEEHVAVLDLVRRGLRASGREPMPRAPRQRVGQAVEVHVGLTEIEQHGFEARPAPRAAIVLATVDGGPRSAVRTERERLSAIGEIYDKERRVATLADVSASGLGLEGPAAACEAMVVGALVAMRLSPGGPLVVGKVTRHLTATPGHAVVGVGRISTDARMVALTAGTGPQAQPVSMLYVQGDDASGRYDGYIIPERTFAERGTFEVVAGRVAYGFRFNRVRERGRGWILAGFEILTARPLGERAA